MNRHRLLYLIRNAIPDTTRQIRWAFQRVFHGHDERVMWGLDSFLTELIPDIERFCHEELDGSATPQLNPERYEVFTETLRLIGELKKARYSHEYNIEGESTAESNLWGYVGSKVGFFWD